MSVPAIFVATCPQCAGTEEVRPEALAAKAGWVRCASCLHIFDGFAENSTSAKLQAATQHPVSAPAQAEPIEASARSEFHPEPELQENSETPCVLAVEPRGIRAGRAPLRAVFPGPQRDIKVPEQAAPPWKHEIPATFENRNNSAAEPRKSESYETTLLLIQANPTPTPTPTPISTPISCVFSAEPELMSLDVVSRLDLAFDFDGSAPDDSLERARPGAELSTGDRAESFEPPPFEDPFSVPLEVYEAGGSSPALAVSIPDVAEVASSDPLESCAAVAPLSEESKPKVASAPIFASAPIPPAAMARARAPRLVPRAASEKAEKAIDEAIAADISRLKKLSAFKARAEPPASALACAPQIQDARLLGDPVVDASEPKHAAPAAARAAEGPLERRIEPRRIALRKAEGASTEESEAAASSLGWAVGGTALERARARLSPPVPWLRREAPARKQIVPDWVGWCVLSLACVALLGQAVHDMRDSIYSKAQWARPALAAACQAAGCKVELATARDYLELEGAQVRSDAQGRLVFTAALRNKASFESLSPKLWISIEGADGKALASRTFKGLEWMGSAAIGAGTSVDAKMVFPAPAPGSEPAGYKAELVMGPGR